MQINLNTVGLPRRLAAILYDSLLLFSLLFIASIVLVLPFEITYQHSLYPLYLIYIYTIGFLFFCWFWVHGGQTLGMKSWKIRVQQKDGRPMTWRLAILRCALALVSWLLLGAGFLWCLFNPQRHALHDIISHTYLVKAG